MPFVRLRNKGGLLRTPRGLNNPQNGVVKLFELLGHFGTGNLFATIFFSFFGPPLQMRNQVPPFCWRNRLPLVRENSVAATLHMQRDMHLTHLSRPGMLLSLSPSVLSTSRPASRQAVFRAGQRIAHQELPVRHSTNEIKRAEGGCSEWVMGKGVVHSIDYR